MTVSKEKTDAKSCIRLWMKSTYSTSAPKRGQLGLYIYIQLNDVKVIKCLVIYNEIYTKQLKTWFYIHFEKKKYCLNYQNVLKLVLLSHLNPNRSL